MTLVVPFDEIFSEDTGLIAKHDTWARVPLGSICSIVNGYPFKSTLFNATRGFPIVRIRDLARNKTETLFDGETPKEAIIKDGDLLIGMDGIFSCYQWSGGTAALNQRVCRIIPNEEYLDKRFLLFAINGYLKRIQENTSSVTVGHLSSNDILRIPLALPPRDEQRRIANRLEDILAEVEKCKNRMARVLLLLKRFRQSVLAAACSGRLTADWRDSRNSSQRTSYMLRQIRERRLKGTYSVKQRGNIEDIYSAVEENDSDALPQGWTFTYLNKLAESFDYGTSTKSTKDGKVPVLRMGNIQGGRIDWGDLVYTSDADEMEKYALEPGTVLFNRTNSPELVGKTAIYRGERPAVFAGYLIRINTDRELDPEYLNLCLNTPAARDFCLRVKTDGVSQSNINAQKLGKFEVPFCSLAEQKEIVQRVAKLLTLADCIESRCDEAKRRIDGLTQSILGKAFRGQLVPTEAELAGCEGRTYESAEDLLARINQQHTKDDQKKARRVK